MATPGLGACRIQQFWQLFTGGHSDTLDYDFLCRSCVCMISVAGEDDSLESVAVGALFALVLGLSSLMHVCRVDTCLALLSWLQEP